MRKATSPTTSRIDPRFVDVRPARGSLTDAHAGLLLRKYGFHPMTPAERRTFGRFLDRREG